MTSDPSRDNRLLDLARRLLSGEAIDWEKEGGEESVVRENLKRLEPSTEKDERPLDLTRRLADGEEVDLSVEKEDLDAELARGFEPPRPVEPHPLRTITQSLSKLLEKEAVRVA